MADNFSVWKEHFIKQAKGLIPHENYFYRVVTAGREEGSMEEGKNNVKVVTPLAQIVERAKNAPTDTYDPTTGVIRQLLSKPRKVRTSKKRAPKKSTKKKAPKKKARKGTKKRLIKKR